MSALTPPSDSLCSYMVFFDPGLPDIRSKWPTFVNFWWPNRPGADQPTYSTYTKVEVVSDPNPVSQVIVDATSKEQPMQPDGAVHNIGSGMVVKRSFSFDSSIMEAHSLQLVRALTSIPVPKVLQLVTAPYHDGGIRTHLVMEYIEGQTLKECWSSLGFFTKLRVVWTLRGYISQLRRITSTVPGPVDGSACVGYYFTDMGAGPFATYDDMNAWFNHKMEVTRRYQPRPPGAHPQAPYTRKFDTSWPLVFTHQDICPRNVILAKDGTLYLIDWAWAGFYPTWFEYAGMARYGNEDIDKLPKSWKYVIPLISGFHDKTWRYFAASIGWALIVGPLL